jgi:hypothetical protein
MISSLLSAAPLPARDEEEGGRMKGWERQHTGYPVGAHDFERAGSLSEVTAKGWMA